jgi:asparagine synthase (glutamine-hydrolysing)
MMNIQYGRWTLDGRPVELTSLRQAAALMKNYGSDHTSDCLSGSVWMFFQTFRTTPQCVNESQPVTNTSGMMLTWDGRLDNREELLGLLHPIALADPTDAEIVLAIYQNRGTTCFRSLLGDWALVLWDPTRNALFLAKDFLGARSLFYRLDSDCGITWSTVLDPLVQLDARPSEISEPFVAGYISTFPQTHLTPYPRIKAVPASAFVQIEAGRLTTKEYWRFDSSQITRYATDVEYERNFLHLFNQAVRRRLRATSPVIAELSGGLDSTSIVCVADLLLHQGTAETPRVDTISYYDDHEPNWNERPYFTLIEKKRGREGYHIDLSGMEGAFESPEEMFFSPLPGLDALTFRRSKEIARCFGSSQSQVLLSGMGGDEVTGGVPTPVPELQDLLASCRFVSFFKRLFQFSLEQRRPWLHLCFAVCEEFLPQPVHRLLHDIRVPPWLTRGFVDRNRDAFWADTRRKKLHGVLPSFQESVLTLKHMQRQIACSHPSPIVRYDKTYPYLDRDLLEFLFSIPREQLLRPGQRRSLFRRALAGAVPSEILARKRKAYVARHSIALMRSAYDAIDSLLEAPRVVSEGWVHRQKLQKAVCGARDGQLDYMIPLKRTLAVEQWLQNSVGHKFHSQGIAALADV